MLRWYKDEDPYRFLLGVMLFIVTLIIWIIRGE